MTTGAFSQNVDKLFSEFKLVPDNLFIYVEANWEATEIAILTQWPNYSVTLCTVLANCQDILCYFRWQIYLLTIAEWRLTWPHKSSWIMACNLISTVWHWSVLTLLWRLYSSLENYEEIKLFRTAKKFATFWTFCGWSVTLKWADLVRKGSMYRFRISHWLLATCICASTTSELYIIGQREGGLANINVVSILCMCTFNTVVSTCKSFTDRGWMKIDLAS